MQFSNEARYRAICSRDYHFDGQFVRASSKLRVYCRPTCATPVPKKENCLFFESGAEAESRGYRPCRRCRPDLSPDAPRWSGTIATVTRALRLIRSGALDEKDVDNLASRVGVTDRHLRRLFKEHLGCSPVTIAIAHRLNLARRMTEEDTTPLIEVAHASGFSSVRRFNDAFRKAYGLTPRQVRAISAEQRSTLPAAVYRLRLYYQRPYHWDAVRQTLRARAIPTVEHVGDSTYQRAVEINGRAGLVTIHYVPDRPYLDAVMWHVAVTDLPAAVAAIRQLLDLDADPQAIARHLRRSDRLRSLTDAHSGIRVPGWWDNFEYILRAVLTAHAGVRANALLQQIIATCGKAVSILGDDVYVQKAFPSIQSVASSEQSLSAIGIPGDVIDIVKALAAQVASGSLSLSCAQNLSSFRASLGRIPGMSEAMARDICRNILERGDAIGMGDLYTMQRELNGDTPTSAIATTRISDTWRPWRAYGMAMIRHHSRDIAGHRFGVPCRQPCQAFAQCTTTPDHDVPAYNSLPGPSLRDAPPPFLEDDPPAYPPLAARGTRALTPSGH
jgi:AraC family transcriptional regulator of adaptative response / DNA-3-methyladenine glycosylase II